jgi:hypothetical protein
MWSNYSLRQCLRIQFSCFWQPCEVSKHYAIL